MRKTLFILCLSLTAQRLSAVDYTGPGRDLADAANWGGVLPGSADEVAFPPSTAPASGYLLSSPVAFGKTTVSAGHAETVVFDLAGQSYTANGAFAVKSDTKITGGHWTNATFSVAAGTTLEVARATLRSVNNIVPLAAGAELHLSDGAVFRPHGKQLEITSGSRWTFDSGALWDCSDMQGEYNRALCTEPDKTTTGAEFLFDGASAKFFTVNLGGKPNGDILGKPVECRFRFVGNSSVSFVGNGNKVSRGWRFGSSNVSGRSVSNLLHVADSTFNCSTYSVSFMGNGDTLAVTNSTFKSENLLVGNGGGNLFSFFNSSVGGSVSFYQSSFSNQLIAVGCTAFPALTINGTGHTVVLSNKVSSTVSLTGTDNTLFLYNNPLSAVTISGERGRVVYETASVQSGLPRFAGEAEGKQCDLAKGTVLNTTMTLEGTNCVLTICSGGRLQYGKGGSSVQKNGFNFKPRATFNYRVRIEEGGTLAFCGTVNFSDNNTPAYNWTNCPNCAIEFRGKNPLLELVDYSENYRLLQLGTADEQPLKDAVRLSFVIPEGGYDAAPIQNKVVNRSIHIYGNQPFEIAFADGWEPATAIDVPLVYCVNNFAEAAGASGDQTVKPTAQRLGKYRENAILHLDETRWNVSFYYNSTQKTIGVRIRRRGMVFILR